jgi:hypothetical protein
MARQVHWIGNGRLQTAPEGISSAFAEKDLLQRQGFVKIEEAEAGTTLRWSMFSANWSSLFYAAEWVHGAWGPFHLQYYSAGWFNERFDHAHAAADRIHHLIHKSDVHLSQTVYIRSAPESRKDVPPLLKRALRDNAADEDCSIDCTYDPSCQRFRVARVGRLSTIAKLWGINPVSYPCLIGHSYDHAVSRVYPEVSRSGTPHYDHIYAAMASANGDVVWVPYQRVVLPLNLGRSRKAVRVVTELAKVDISPL